MYSVFLVEDEVVIREGIRKLIAWEEHGFTFAGEAPDGEIAWPLIQKQRPDIVITDIKMPFLDGLALSRLIKKELPQTTILILSGYDDFSYAKEAISVGVSQYLLKPLSRNQLIEVLGDIKKQKDKEQEQQRYLAQFTDEMQEYLASSRRGFFDALVSGRAPIPDLLERAEKLGLDLVAEQYNIVLFLVEDVLPAAAGIEQAAGVQDTLYNSFVSDPKVAVFRLGIDMLVFLVRADGGSIEQETQRCADAVETRCAPLGKAVRWSVVIGKPVTRLSAVAQCYRRTRQALFQLGPNDGGRLHRVPQGTHPTALLDFDPSEMDAAQMDQRIVEKFLSSGLPEEVPAFVDDYFEAIGEASVQSMMFRQYFVLNIQFTVSAFLKRLGCEPPAILKENTLYDALASVEGARSYTKNLLGSALALRDQVVNSRYTSMLQKTVAYLKQQYAQPDISLNTVAGVAGMSPSHFSTVFSQQMGQTFVEYLTSLRMEQARSLLRCTDKSSGDIALEVGYNDPHYFSFLFKKVNGCSPRDYRMGRKSG